MVIHTKVQEAVNGTGGDKGTDAISEAFFGMDITYIALLSQGEAPKAVYSLCRHKEESPEVCESRRDY